MRLSSYNQVEESYMKLRQLREKKGISQRELGDSLNLSQRAISRYESGEAEPDLATVRKISEFFNVTIDFLLGEDDSNIILITRKDLESIKEVERHLQSAMDQLVSITEKISSGEQAITIGNGNTIQNSFNHK